MFHNWHRSHPSGTKNESTTRLGIDLNGPPGSIRSDFYNNPHFQKPSNQQGCIQKSGRDCKSTQFHKHFKQTQICTNVATTINKSQCWPDFTFLQMFVEFLGTVFHFLLTLRSGYHFDLRTISHFLLGLRLGYQSYVWVIYGLQLS